MNWEERLITAEELRVYQDDDADESLEAQVAALIDQQADTWPLLADGLAAFLDIETKRVPLDAAEIVVQYNPRRIRSTGAQVDRASVEQRRCFLCAANLPPEEKGIAYGEHLVILCNPFPVLDRHLSIVHRKHIPQQIEQNVETLLSLARDLGPSYFVLYNGPECGASAPDPAAYQQ